MAKKKPIRKHIDGPDVPLPQTWNQFIALDMNKTNLARFLSDALMKRGKDLKHTYKLVTGGGFPDPQCAASTRRNNMRLNGNHEEADTHTDDSTCMWLRCQQLVWTCACHFGWYRCNASSTSLSVIRWNVDGLWDDQENKMLPDTCHRSHPIKWYKRPGDIIVPWPMVMARIPAGKHS